FFHCSARHLCLHSFPTRRSSDLSRRGWWPFGDDRRGTAADLRACPDGTLVRRTSDPYRHVAERLLFDDRDLAVLCRIADDQKDRSEEHTSELQSRENLVCRLLLE